MAQGEAAFRGSLAALIEWAQVTSGPAVGFWLISLATRAAF